MNKVLIGLVATLGLGIASASPTAQQQHEVLQSKFESATVVTSCNEIVVIVITSENGKTYIVDKDSGIPADAIKKALSASHAKLTVYEIGCEVPEIRT